MQHWTICLIISDGSMTGFFLELWTGHIGCCWVSTDSLGGLFQPWRLLVLKNNIAANLEEIREEIKKELRNQMFYFKTPLFFLGVTPYFYEIPKKKNRETEYIQTFWIFNNKFSYFFSTNTNDIILYDFCTGWFAFFFKKN